jgi:hypothetical protein
MVLTFEVSKSGKSMDICFDGEGRDQLISLLSRCKKAGDHEHMLRLEVASPTPGNLITMEQFGDDTKPIEEVILWIVEREGPDADS